MTFSASSFSMNAPAVSRRVWLAWALGGFAPAAFAGGEGESPGEARAEPRIDRLIVADERGDHGLPAPFTHAPDGVGYALTMLVFDALLWRDRQGQLVPALARQWHESDDRLSVTFELQPQARWHGGKPVTADDVAFTFDYFRQHPDSFMDVSAVAGVDAPDAGRARVRLKQPDASFVPQLAAALPILPRHVFAPLADPRRMALQEVVGSGPYRVAGYDKAGGRYRFVAHDGHYLGRPRVRELLFVRMEPALALGALRRGEVDVIRSLPLHLLPQAERFATVVKAQSGHPARLRFNYARAPFADKRLRHAIARGIDRQALLRIVENGLGEVSAGRFLRGSPWQTGEPLAAYAFDAQAAREQLRQLGYTPDAQGQLRRADGEPFSARLFALRGQARLAQALAAQLQALGLAIDVQLMERSVLATRLGAGEFDLAIVSQGVNGDPGNMARQMAGTAPFSDAFRSRADLLDLLERQARAASVDERRALIEQAQAIYAEELPSFYLYSPLWATASNARFRPWFTPGGFAFGVPLPLNKLMFTQ